MKTYILIKHISKAGLVWVYGTITAADENAAAATIGSKVIEASSDGALRTRYSLEGSKWDSEVFLEEVPALNSRPGKL